MPYVLGTIRHTTYTPAQADSIKARALSGANVATEQEMHDVVDMFANALRGLPNLGLKKTTEVLSETLNNITFSASSDSLSFQQIEDRIDAGSRSIILQSLREALHADNPKATTAQVEDVLVKASQQWGIPYKAPSADSSRTK